MTAADFTEPYAVSPKPESKTRPRPATIADLRNLEASILAAVTYSAPSAAPPRDLEAEDFISEAAITGALTDEDVEGLSADDFFGDTGRLIFTIWASDERPDGCDLKGWHTALSETGLRGAVAAELVRIINDAPAARGAHLRRFVLRVRQTAAARIALRHMAYADAVARSYHPGNGDTLEVMRASLQKALEALTLP